MASRSGGGTGGGSGEKDKENVEEEWEYYDDNEVLTDFWQYFVDNDVDFKKPFQAWMKYFSKKYENDFGFNIFLEYWRVWVPLLLSPRNGTTSVDGLSEKEKRQVEEILLAPLEEFICGTTEVHKVFSELSAADSPPAMCGYVFNTGDTCYSCRDCGQDATCVLCLNCFNNSEHKKHKYKIHTSSGAGYCDCGDQEAFLKHHLCSVHATQAAQSKSSKQVSEAFSPDLVERTKHLFWNIAVYALNIIVCPQGVTDLISGLKEKELFPDLQYPLKYSNYCAVLLNDENHSYNEVISVLGKVLPQLSRKTISDITTFVDKQGKAVVKVGSYKECCDVSQKIENLTRIPHTSVLQSSVVKSYLIAHERFVQFLLDWVPTLFEKSTGFRALFSEVMLEKDVKYFGKIVRYDEESPNSLCEAVLLNGRNSWKQVRNLWMKLLIDGMLKDYETKKELAVLFTNNYARMVYHFICDDQERESSLTALSVQLFTVPSLATYLIEHCDGFSKLLSAFRNMIKDSVTDDNELVLSTFLEEEKNVFDRTLTCLTDITYLLSVIPGDASIWTSGLRTSFTNGLHLILDILRMMQGMDKMKRQLGNRVEMEDMTWKLAYELQASLREVLRLVARWVASDPNIYFHTITHILRLINGHYKRPSGSGHVFPIHTKTHEFLGQPAKTYFSFGIDVSVDKVSLHIPLHRFFASLLMVGAANSRINELEQDDCNSRAATTPGQRLTADLLSKRIQNELLSGECDTHRDYGLMLLCEPVNQVLVAVAQINIGMWRRNGTMADNQAFLYSSRKYCTGLKESDLLLLQLGIALCGDVDQFLVNMLSRYRLCKWATGNLDRGDLFKDVGNSDQQKNYEEIAERINSLGDQWLQIVIALLGERHTPGLGQGCTAKTSLKRDVLHILCIEPTAHSVVVKRLPIDSTEADGINSGKQGQLDEILNEIAVMKSGPGFTDMGNGLALSSSKRVYHVKPGLVERNFNIFYYGYTKEQQTEAQETQLEAAGKLRKQRQSQSSPQGRDEPIWCCNPPQLPALCPLYSGLSRLASSNVILQVCKQVLERSKSLKQGSPMSLVTEAQIHKVLYILGLGIREEEAESGRPGSTVQFRKKAEEAGIWRLLESMLEAGADSLSSHVIDLGRWLLHKVTPVRRKKEQSAKGDSSSQEAMDIGTSESEAGGSGTSAEQLRKRRAEAVAARKAKIMAQMSAMQKNFATENKAMLDNIRIDDKEPKAVVEEQQDDAAMPTVCLGPQQTAVGAGKPAGASSSAESFTCILCMEEQTPDVGIAKSSPHSGTSSSAQGASPNASVVVLAAYVQNTTVLSSRQLPEEEAVSEELPAFRPMLLSADRGCGPLLSTCGHAMHAACFQKYFETMVAKERERNSVLGLTPAEWQMQLNFDVSKGEYVCPFCDRMSNTVLPVTPSMPELSKILRQQAKGGIGGAGDLSTDISLMNFLRCLKHISDTTKVGAAGAKDNREAEAPARHLLQVQCQSSWQELSSLHGPELDMFMKTLWSGAGLLSEKFVDMQNVMLMGVFTNSLALHPDDEDERFLLLTLQTAALTTVYLERWLHYENKPLFNGLNPRDTVTLRHLVRCITTLPVASASCRSRLGHLRKNFLRLIKFTMTNQFEALCHGERGQKGEKELLELSDIDAFHLLVSLVTTLPCLLLSQQKQKSSDAGKSKADEADEMAAIYSGLANCHLRLPNGRGLELHLLKICLLIHVMQVIRGLPEKEFVRFVGGSRTENKDDLSVLRQLVGVVTRVNGYSVARSRETRSRATEPSVNCSKLLDHLETAVIPFMRSAALFFRHYTDIPPGPNLGEGGDESYPELARYLGLPDRLEMVVTSPGGKYYMELLVNNMAATEERLSDDKVLRPSSVPVTHPLSLRYNYPPPAGPRCSLSYFRCDERDFPPFWNNRFKSRNPPGHVGLIPLPHDYSVLMSIVANFRCGQSVVTGESSKHPAICLVCGLIVCSHSHCCERSIGRLRCGGATAHARSCGADTAIFLKIKECCIVLHSKIYRGAFLPAPYLDEYGEADQGLRRGNPLYLDKDKYEELNRMYLRNEIPERICRNYDPDVLLLIDWHLI